MSSSNQWFFALNGERAGPVDIQTLAGMIQSGRLPPDVLVCREGMEEWMPANDLGLIQQNTPAQVNSPIKQGGKPAVHETTSNGLAYALGAVIVLILAVNFGYNAVQGKKHKKEVEGLNNKMEGLEQTGHSSSNALVELKELKLKFGELLKKEIEAKNQLTNLNASKINLTIEKQNLLTQLTEATNRLAQISNAEGTNEKVKLADLRALKAEQKAEDIQSQLDETIKKSQSQAAELQRQNDQKEERIKNQIKALQDEKDALAIQLQIKQSNLVAATQLNIELKEELGNSPIRIGTPKGPKPGVTVDFFGKVGSTDELFNFAVINKGSVDGVKVGDTFRVESKENGETICTLKITEVKPKVALGNPGTLNVSRITLGDLVYRE